MLRRPCLQFVGINLFQCFPWVKNQCATASHDGHYVLRLQLWTIISSFFQDKVKFLFIIDIIFLSLSSIAVLLFPCLILLTYRAEVYESQPFFFGFEGYMGNYDLELLVFGTYERRLQWSTANSPLSRHHLDFKGMMKDMDLQPDEAEKIIRNEEIFTGLDPVLRMETRVWDKMDTMARVRIGMNRKDGREAIRDPRDFIIYKGAWWKRLMYAIGARV